MKKVNYMVVAWLIAVVLAVAWALSDTAEATLTRGAKVTSFVLDTTDCSGSAVVIGEAIINRGQGGLVNVEVFNDGTSALTGFNVQMQAYNGGAWYTVLTDTDFDSTSELLPFVSTTGPHEVGNNGYAYFHMRTRGAYAIRFSADAGGTAEVTIGGTFSAE